jgi:hypothetical protein
VLIKLTIKERKSGPIIGNVLINILELNSSIKRRTTKIALIVILLLLLL